MSTTSSGASAGIFRLLPAMSAVLDALEASPDSPPELLALPRPLLKECIDSFLDNYRSSIREGAHITAEDLALPALLPEIIRYAVAASRPHFRRVINATGVIIHTNLGRSLLAEEAVRAVADSCRHYSNLELNLATGQRGDRYSHVEGLLCRLTGAEAALVVNNNAAGVFIILDTLCKGREVVVSRGELVEIGGSFRIPDVMAKSGCLLREVGTTNRTRLEDYAAAVTGNTAALMKVHTSNYRIVGFTGAVSRRDLAGLARQHGLPLIEDLGSGVLCPLPGIPEAYAEPAVQEAVKAGMDVVAFSGDKILGGPQAGIIVGKAEIINQIKNNPLNRALRIDKMTLAALEATLRLYLDPRQAAAQIPTLRMLHMSSADLRDKAEALLQAVVRSLPPQPELQCSLIPGMSQAGGGAFPECNLPTTLVALHGPSPDTLRKRLLQTDPPVAGRIERDAFCLDPRTLEVDEFPLIVRALRQALQF